MADKKITDSSVIELLKGKIVGSIYKSSSYDVLVSVPLLSINLVIMYHRSSPERTPDVKIAIKGKSNTPIHLINLNKTSLGSGVTIEDDNTLRVSAYSSDKAVYALTLACETGGVVSFV